MKKEGYNLSMSEILSSIRSDIFAEHANNNYNNYSAEDYNKNRSEVMSLSGNDNEGNQNDSTAEPDDEILELDDTFLESQDEQFDLSSKKTIVNQAHQDLGNAIRNEKLKKSRKIDPRATKLKKSGDQKSSIEQRNDMSDEVDNFLKLIEENTDDLTFEKPEKDFGKKTYNEENTTKPKEDNNILNALNKANELIQQKSSENDISVDDNVVKNASPKEETQDQKYSGANIQEKENIVSDDDSDVVEDIVDDNRPQERVIPSIMSESAKKASMKSIHKIIETQKKIQSEKRQTIDDLAMAALIPMLQDWMDKNLAKIVEKVVEKEISKLINMDN